MRMLALAAAVFGVACGDDGVTPAADAHSPDALVCGANEMVCSDTCAATLTDEQNCGTCGNVCGANDACVSGTCMPANIHCQRVREADADAPDGTYVNPATDDAFYCDFTNGVTVDDFAIAAFDATVPDYTLLTGDAFAADPTLQKAFIGIFNVVGGVKSIATFESAPCCFRAAPNTALLFGGHELTPVIEGTYSCGNIGVNRTYTLSLSGPAMEGWVAAPLPDDFFTTNPISQGTKCSPDEMSPPGIFYKKHDGLL